MPTKICLDDYNQPLAERALACNLAGVVLPKVGEASSIAIVYSAKKIFLLFLTT